VQGDEEELLDLEDGEEEIDDDEALIHQRFFFLWGPLPKVS